MGWDGESEQNTWMIKVATSYRKTVKWLGQSNGDAPLLLRWASSGGDALAPRNVNSECSNNFDAELTYGLIACGLENSTTPLVLIFLSSPYLLCFGQRQWSTKRTQRQGDDSPPNNKVAGGDETKLLLDGTVMGLWQRVAAVVRSWMAKQCDNSLKGLGTNSPVLLGQVTDVSDATRLHGDQLLHCEHCSTMRRVAPATAGKWQESPQQNSVTTTLLQWRGSSVLWPVRQLWSRQHSLGKASGVGTLQFNSSARQGSGSHKAASKRGSGGAPRWLGDGGSLLMTTQCSTMAAMDSKQQLSFFSGKVATWEKSSSRRQLTRTR